MPELPEVETIRTQLESVLLGQTITDVEVRLAKVFKGKKELLIGKKIVGFRRYSKLLVIDCSGGVSVAIHLKMTGRLVYSGEKLKVQSVKWELDYSNDKHTHVVFAFEDGSHLYFHDYRRFGYVEVLGTPDVEKLSYVKELGPEFFRNLTKEQFIEVVSKAGQPIKVVLMDQQKLGGVGNIYANEGLWEARIHPKTKGRALNEKQIGQLFDCLEDLMKEAIAGHGASDNAYRDAFGQKGDFQNHFRVYAQEGKPCKRCTSPIKKIVVGGRGTFFCDKCQVLSK